MDYASEQIAGVDEVGRGALFGPVVAATVILSDGAIEQLVAQGMTDSKKLSPRRRMILMNQIREVAMGFRVGMASVYEIDRLNILQASLLAMRRAVLGLPSTPQFCLVDGNQRIPNLPVPQRTVVKGDQSEPAIAAASILAKVWRDQLIVRLDQRYPGYDLASNKGYGSATHRQALRELGPTRQHRLSFAPCQVSLLPD
ncbi:ribonuclease HII [Acaryochloris sp. CCMEE 5410]|uniref:ribonuclease HII n=1 Tax=Acaryochloris sp. CCMEE 5410 TaxID=310037 RepID=UPI00024851C8|nr:ribonuclease HII [Acaryochloris sp. CCMEE 5410]KAI9133685.1 ribonuclease HII [Acaryochloris sp. CCMEE 5410]